MEWNVWEKILAAFMFLLNNLEAYQVWSCWYFEVKYVKFYLSDIHGNIPHHIVVTQDRLTAIDRKVHPVPECFNKLKNQSFSSVISNSVYFCLNLYT